MGCKQLSYYRETDFAEETPFVAVHHGKKTKTLKKCFDPYLYEVNDHLGNVRAVLGTPHRLTYTATMETDITHRLQEEEKYFANIPNTRWTFVGANKTPDGSKVAALNQAKPIGRALMTSVSPGDTLYIHTWAYYEAGSGYNKRMPLASIISAVSGAYGGSPTGSEQARQTFGAFNNALTAFGTGNGGSETDPNAHLNYILFNRDMMPIQHGFVPVTSAARNNPDKERVALDPLNIAIEGILYVYVSNTSASDHKVYFDDLTITHHTSPVVYANDHYPFGLPMAGRQITRERYRYDYQGQYAEKDEETGWNYFEARYYDPVIGRWMATDPARQFWSPYIGMGNNPINQIDPDGAFSKFGALWRSMFGLRGRVYQSGVDGVKEVWGYERDGVHYFGDDARNNFHDGPILQQWIPNVFEHVYNGLTEVGRTNPEAEFVGKLIYGVIDDAYVAIGQVGKNRYHLNGTGVWPNEIQDAGVGSLLTLNPITTLGAGIPSKTLNGGQFNRLFKGTGYNSGKKFFLKSYNNVIRGYHKFIRDVTPFFNGKGIYDTTNKTVTE